MDKNYGATVKRIALEIRVIFGTLVVILGMNIFFPLCIAASIYRRLIILLASIFRPKLTRIVEGGNLIFALDDTETRPKANIVTCFVLDGNVADHLEELRAAFTSRVLEKRINKKSGQDANIKPQLFYPELQQVWSPFLGYYFWKNEICFDVKEHIRIGKFVNGVKVPHQDPGVCTQSDLQELATRLLSAPWKKDFSPWEVLIIPNYEAQACVQQSVIIIRVHHAMGDGKSWMNMWLSDFAQFKEAQLPAEKWVKSHRKMNFWRALVAPAKIPYDFVKSRILTQDCGHNVWNTREKRTKDYFSTITPSISVQFIKDIKNKFEVSYATVLMSAISGGINRVMKESGQVVPKNIIGSLAFPMPFGNQAGRLQVHASVLPLMWPIGMENAIERLRTIQDEMEKNKSNTYPLTLYYLTKLLSLFPRFVLRSVCNMTRYTLIASLFPGPMGTPKIQGFDIVDSMVFLGHFSEPLGIAVSTVVIGGRQRIIVTIDKTLFPSVQKFETLGRYIHDELEILNNNCLHLYKEQTTDFGVNWP